MDNCNRNSCDNKQGIWKLGDIKMNDNASIAEFMGYERQCGFYYIEQFEKPCNHSEGMTSSFGEDELEYHSSWDWLMPVVRKINESGYPMCGTLLAQKVYQSCGIAQVELVYKSVVEFIKWYNEQGE